MFKLKAKTRKKEKKQEEDNDDELTVMFYDDYSGDCRSCPFYGLCGG